MELQERVGSYNRYSRLVSLDQIIREPRFKGDKSRSLQRYERGHYRETSGRSNEQPHSLESSSQQKGSHQRVDSRLLRNLMGKSNEDAK